MRVRAGARFKEITGDVLVGLTKTGKVRNGTWLHCSFNKGDLVSTAELSDPDDFRGRLDLLADDVADARPACDLKVAIRDLELSRVQGDVVAAFASGLVYVFGDESFFIRFSPDVLALIGAVEA